MKNALNYYYNLLPEDIRQSKTQYYFDYLGNDYVFELCSRTPEEVNEIYQLSHYFYQYGINIHQIILNNQNEMITFINNNPYILMRRFISDDNKITVDDLDVFNNFAIVTREGKINRNNWRTLWIKRIDYIEFQINEYQNKYKVLRETIDYFIGLTETGIQLLNNINSNQHLVLAHRRIKIDTKKTDLYNPLNMIVDSRVRDIAEYFKNKFFRKHDVYDDIISYLQKHNLTADEYRLFFIRFLFPSNYFDLYDMIIQNEFDEQKIDNLINSIVAYERLLKKLYLYLYQRNIMPEIIWLKNVNH